MTEAHKPRVFLCHSSQDKPVVREMYQRLLAEEWIDPWLDEEKLLPGQDWEKEIESAVTKSSAVIVFLSNNSVSKEGYIQKELRFVLSTADYMPQGKIFIIPIRLDDCMVPHPLKKWQYIDWFPEVREKVYARLLGALRSSFTEQGFSSEAPSTSKQKEISTHFMQISLSSAQLRDGSRVRGENAYYNLGLSPGLHEFNGIPINYEYEIFTQNSDYPNNPQFITVAFHATKVISLHFLMQADWGLKKFDRKQVGKIVFNFESNETFEYRLILGENIRDWSRGSSYNAVSTISSPDAANVWTGVAGGKTGGMDLLTITLPSHFQVRPLKSVDIIDTSLDTTGNYNPGIHILGLTAKIIE